MLGYTSPLLFFLYLYMGCNCKGDKLINLKKIMKNNVTYKLKKAYKHLDYVIFSGTKFFVDGMTQQMMSILYKNNTDFVEIIEDTKPTNTYDKKKTNKKK